MTSSRLNLGSTSKILNLSLLRFNEQFRFQNHANVWEPVNQQWNPPFMKMKYNGQDPTNHIISPN